MKKTSLYALMCASLSSVFVCADSYQVEVEGSAYVIESNFNEVSDINLRATGYFQSVDTSKGPLKEAAFLDKASSVGWFYTAEPENYGNGSNAVDTRLVIGDDWIVEGRYTDTNSYSSYGAGIGKYLNDTTDIVLFYQTDDADWDKHDFNLQLHSLVSNIGFDITASYIDVKNIGFLRYDATLKGIYVDVTYYLDSRIGFGLKGSFRSIDNNIDEYTNEVYDYGVHAHHFIRDNIKLEATYQANYYEGDKTGAFANLSAAVRF